MHVPGSPRIGCFEASHQEVPPLRFVLSLHPKMRMVNQHHNNWMQQSQSLAAHLIDQIKQLYSRLPTNASPARHEFCFSGMSDIIFSVWSDEHVGLQDNVGSVVPVMFEVGSRQEKAGNSLVFNWRSLQEDPPTPLSVLHACWTAGWTFRSLTDPTWHRTSRIR